LPTAESWALARHGDRSYLLGAGGIWLVNEGTIAKLRAFTGDPHSAMNGLNVLVFVADDELWTSDGTADGTQAVASVPGGKVARDEITVVGDNLIFGGIDDAHGWELWSVPLRAIAPLD
jgi:ELWxxDGT repeat protein